MGQIPKSTGMVGGSAHMVVRLGLTERVHAVPGKGSWGHRSSKQTSVSGPGPAEAGAAGNGTRGQVAGRPSWLLHPDPSWRPLQPGPSSARPPWEPSQHLGSPSCVCHLQGRQSSPRAPSSAASRVQGTLNSGPCQRPRLPGWLPTTNVCQPCADTGAKNDLRKHIRDKGRALWGQF